MCRKEYVLSAPQALRQNNALTQISCFPELFTAQECAQIIALRQSCESLPSQIAAAGKTRPDYRNSQSYILDPEAGYDWIYERVLEQGAHYAQQAHFSFACMESLQILEYHSGGFFNWHMDLGHEAMSTRKFSMVILLSRPESFKGGRLEFLLDKDPYVPKLTQGSAVFFPAFILHQLSPVIRGPRFALVSWFNGHAFH